MPYETIKHGGRTLRRWIPEKAIVVREKSGLGVVYVYNLPNPATGCERILAVAYRGNAAQSSFHYSYKDSSKVEQDVRKFFDGLRQHKELVSKHRAEQYAPHTFKVGDIITNSWGYDQTNVDWYRVSKISEHYVWLQPICGRTEETGFMSGNSTPHVDTSNEDPAKWGFQDTKETAEKHRASGDYISMKYGCGKKWNGEKVYESWYH